jgi:diguanylate cyclase (GGDEF)-like protein/PAS domain S-box-containing protein
MLILDPDTGEIAKANLAANNFYGYALDELESMNIRDLNTLSQQQIDEEIQRAKSESRNYFIFGHRVSDGSIRVVEVHAFPVNYNDKKHLFSTIVDITQQRDLESPLWHQQSQLQATVDSQIKQMNEISLRKFQLLGAALIALLALVVLLWRARNASISSRQILDREHQRLNDVIEGTNSGIWEWATQKNIIEVNERWANMFGYSVEEVTPLTTERWESMVHPDDIAHLHEQMRAHLDGEIDRYQLELRLRHKNGSWVWIVSKGKLVNRSGGQSGVVSGTIQDITQRRKNEEELRKLSRAIEFSPSSIIILDSNGVIEYVNPTFERTTGYEKSEIVGSKHRSMKSKTSSEVDYDSMYGDLWARIEAGLDWRGEVRNSNKDGSYYWVRESVSSIKDKGGKITHYVSIQDDITNEYELNEKLTFQATHDILTGLINRYEFERRTKQALENLKTVKAEHALCFIDLDQFKVINDTCGHVAGDELLRQLGRVLQCVVRESDTLARLGGDEFGLLMENCTIDQSQRVADLILIAAREFQFIWDRQVFRIGLSIGLVAITDGNQVLKELLQQADAACYMAKDRGRDRIHIYHPDDAEMALRKGEMQWVAQINQALDQERFCLYAQPIKGISGNHEMHYEVLLRLLNEKGEIVSPGAFLPAAERYNLIEKLDRWVVKNTFELMARNPAFFDKIHFISINLSGKSLTNPKFLETIFSELNRTKIQSEQICFEVTETEAISNLDAASTFISILKEVGFSFALDDFGSGLSSFGYLKTLPVDYLKIDGMFVKDIVNDPIDKAMVESINNIGHVMGMKTIAEFVENDEIKIVLEDIGVDYVQGYGVGKPEPFNALIEKSR